MERDQILLRFDARFFLDHVRIAKKVPTRKIKTHAITIPAMAPEFNDDVERILLFCDKGAPEDVGGDKVDEDVDEDGDKDTDEASDVEEVVVAVVVDIRDGEELISLVVTVVVVFNEMLVKLLVLDWIVVECEGADVETSDRILMTVTVVGEISPVLSSLFLSSMGRTTMSFKIMN